MRHFVPLLACMGLVMGNCWAASAQDYARLESDVWHLRITNPANARAKLCVRVYFNPNRPPWWGDKLYLARGGEQENVPPKADWLEPGESSDWVDIGPHMSKSPLFAGSPDYLSTVFIGAMYDPPSGNLRLIAEVARGPEKRREAYRASRRRL